MKFELSDDDFEEEITLDEDEGEEWQKGRTPGYGNRHFKPLVSIKLFVCPVVD